MIPEGRFKAVVMNYTLDATDGKECVPVEFEFPELEGTPHLTWYGYLHTEKVFPHTMKALRVLGWTGNDITDFADGIEDTAGIRGAEASVEVEHQEYEGKIRAKIKWVNDPSGIPTLAPPEPASAKRFAASIKGKILAYDQSSPKVAKAAKPKAKKAVDNGDIPF